MHAFCGLNKSDMSFSDVMEKLPQGDFSLTLKNQCENLNSSYLRILCMSTIINTEMYYIIISVIIYSHGLTQLHARKILLNLNIISE